jgi:hypothetical protein
LVLALAWAPALGVAWGICPYFLKLIREFEVAVPVATSVLLQHAWWAYPALGVALVSWASWQRSIPLRMATIVAALVAAALPIALGLFFLQEILTKLG